MDSRVSALSARVTRWGGLSAAIGGVVWIFTGVLVWIYGQLLLTESGRAYQTLAGLTFTVAPLLLSGGVLGLYAQILRRPLQARRLRWTAVTGVSIVGIVVLVSVVELARIFFLAPIFTGAVGVPGLLSGSIGHYAVALSIILLGIVGLRMGVLGPLKGLPLGIGLLMISPVFYVLLSTPFFLIGGSEGTQLGFLGSLGLAFFFFLLPFGIAGVCWVLFGYVLWSRRRQDA